LLVLGVFLVWACIGGWLLWRGERELGQQARGNAGGSISVVIPTRNEARNLPETIREARAVPEIGEIIVVDGESVDGTAEVAERLGCRVLRTFAGRGGQLREGAAVAKGEVVLLLHADTWLPSEAGHAILNCLRDQRVVGGGFWKQFRERSIWMAGSRIRCALRMMVGGTVLGDQAIFVRKDVLEEIGGIPDLPLMEEFELCRRLRKRGKLVLASATVQTSARRFLEHGILRTYWKMCRITCQYYFGTSTRKLQRLYDQE
jgi:rSAM/selenodomain-associated transferase 2